MGYVLDWVSIGGLTRDEVFERLGLVDAGEAVDYPRRGGFMWAVTPAGRVVVATSSEWLDANLLSELSRGTSLVAASAEDNDCTSSAWGYEDGRKTWSVIHDNGGQHHGKDELVIEGEPPVILSEIHARAMAERDAEEDKRVDFIFDVPNDLVAAVGGWAPESAIGSDLQFFMARRAGAMWEAMPAARTRHLPLIVIVASLALLAVAIGVFWIGWGL